MRTKLTAIILILLVFAFALCGCFNSPYAEQVITDVDTKPTDFTRKLYVSGAVANDGYITVPQLCDYKKALTAAGLTDYSFVRVDLNKNLPVDIICLIVDFTYDGVVCPSVNVNGGYVTLRSEVAGGAPSVVNRLADYIESHGVITNRDALKQALGDDYADNYYKFYIDINDYA